jgi:hypothetical protein
MGIIYYRMGCDAMGEIIIAVNLRPDGFGRVMALDRIVS